MTKISREASRNVIHVGDGLEFMRSMRDASVDAVITDPPYCSGAVSEASRVSAQGQGLRHQSRSRFGWFVGDNMGTAGLTFLLRSIAFESVRVLRPTGSLVVFCDWRMLSSLQPAIESAGLRYQSLGVWDKGSVGLGKGFRHTHELFLHFTVGSPKYYDQGVANVIHAPRIRGKDREHQTQKPIALLRPIVRVVAPPGGTVFDPFCGSGSTGVACVTEGRDFIGVERDAGIAEVARRRMSESSCDPVASEGSLWTWRGEQE